MQAGLTRGLISTVVRFFNRGLLLSLIFVLPTLAVSAQQASPMHPSLVLVLKLV